jgi:chemotaxis protein CheD
MEPDQTMVRMGELAVSFRRGQLVALGLGSCIGLALLDRRLGTAGLAHVVLPQSPDSATERSLKFADHAVPELVSRLTGLGARRIRLEAVLVGGASMFAASPALEVGARNEAAVREQLESLRIPVLASATGGSRGRTLRVDVATTTVSVREAGGKDAELVAPTRAIEVAA